MKIFFKKDLYIRFIYNNFIVFSKCFKICCLIRFFNFLHAFIFVVVLWEGRFHDLFKDIVNLLKDNYYIFRE